MTNFNLEQNKQKEKTEKTVQLFSDNDKFTMELAKTMEKSQERLHKLEIKKIHEQFKADLVLKLIEKSDYADIFLPQENITGKAQYIYNKVFGEE